MKITIEKNDGKMTVREGRYALLVTSQEDRLETDALYDTGVKTDGEDHVLLAAAAMVHAAEAGELPRELFPVFVAKVLELALALNAMGRGAPEASFEDEDEDGGADEAEAAPAKEGNA